MKVETYECSETQAESISSETSKEAVALIEQLNLEGQKSLLGKTINDKPLRCPYRTMKPEEEKVFNLLCSTHIDVERYAAGPIPLRALQVIAHAQSLNFFDEIQIWSAEGEIKDPVAIGRKKDSQNTWRSNQFLLVRWADELDNWPSLCKKAMEVWKNRTKIELQKIIKKVESDISVLERIENMAQLTKTDNPFYNSAF